MAEETASDARTRPDVARVTLIHGPIVSSSDLPAHIRLFEAFGLEVVGSARRTSAETLALWDVALACTEVQMSTPGTPFGVRLVGFAGAEPRIIRDPARGYDAEALKVIDFYTPDLPRARAAIEAGGFRFRPDVADYETPEGRFQEAHLWGPDGVVCALITGEPSFFEDFATIRDRLFSEPQSISGPTRDPSAALAFFGDVFGLKPVHTYGIDADESFQALVGAPETLRLRAWNVGLTTREPYFGIIDYGLPAGEQVSLRERARPPACGLLGATLVVSDLAAIVGRARDAVVCPPTQTWLPGAGKVHAAALRAPNGAWLQVLEIVEATPG